MTTETKPIKFLPKDFIENPNEKYTLEKLTQYQLMHWTEWHNEYFNSVSFSPLPKIKRLLVQSFSFISSENAFKSIW